MEKLGAHRAWEELPAPNLTGLPLLNLSISPACTGTFPQELSTQWRKSQVLKYNKRVLPSFNGQALVAAWT